MWNYIPKDGNPKKEDRYLIVYRYIGETRLRYFTGDFVCDRGGSWGIMHDDDIEVIAWKEIEPFTFLDIK